MKNKAEHFQFSFIKVILFSFLLWVFNEPIMFFTGVNINFTCQSIIGLMSFFGFLSVILNREVK